jgi:hypothetical protein
LTREDVLLFEHALVVVLAEGAKKLGRFAESGSINRSGRFSEVLFELGIDEESAADDAVFAHEVFGGGDFGIGGGSWLRPRSLGHGGEGGDAQGKGSVA